MPVRAFARILSGSALTFGLVIGAVVPSQAAVTEQERADGLWYASALRLDELQASGHTGEGVKIAVIDSGINTAVPELQGANIQAISLCAADYARTEVYPADSDDTVQVHGTGVTSMLVGNGIAGDGGPGTRGIAPDAEILFYGLPKEADGASKPCYPVNQNASQVIRDLGGVSYAIVAAVMDGAQVISISQVEEFELFDDEYNLALAFAARAGVPVVAGTPNPGMMSAGIPYPFNGVVSVGALMPDGTPLSIGSADSGRLGDGPGDGSPNLAISAPGTNFLQPAGPESWEPAIRAGTSLATPLVAGTIALGLEAYPNATGYQVLQAMIRTTGTTGLAEPQWVDHLYGYGVLNPTAMLAIDPTQFPDENPLFVKDVSDPRCQGAVSMESCAWATHPTTEDFDRIWAQWEASDPTVLPEPAPTPDLGVAPGVVLLWVLGGVVALGLVAVAVIVPVVVSRSRRRRERAEAEMQAHYRLTQTQTLTQTQVPRQTLQSVQQPISQWPPQSEHNERDGVQR